MGNTNLTPRNDEMINYLFRPAKNVERKMLCEAFGMLSTISDIKEYQYIGFGSVYFADFNLFHKQLGVANLISIEGIPEMENRVRFNQPYSCIEFIPGWSTDVLPQVNWKKSKSILWLDYTGSLENYMLKDITTFFQRGLSGSMFVISINVDLREQSDTAKTIYEKIKKKLDKDSDIRKKIRTSEIHPEMTKRDYYQIVRNVINTEIESTLSKRNKLEEDNFEYHQLFNFIYQDGQVMMTIGGILVSDKDKETYEKINFTSLDFVRTTNDIYEIKVPNLTLREIQALNKYLPNFSLGSEEKDKILLELGEVVSNDEIEKYARIYRYFPNFSESYL